MQENIQSEMQHCFSCHGEHRRGTTYICQMGSPISNCEKCKIIPNNLLPKSDKKCNYCPNCGYKL